MGVRKEKDSIGEVEVPDDVYYGAQTQRSYQNFPFEEKMPLEVIYALALIKKAAATVNFDCKLISKEQKETVILGATAILAKKLDDNFILSVWQTGSGTQTNMNVNEVISNYAIESLGGVMGSKEPIHPNDHVNCSQSSNDTFPTAMHISAVTQISRHLLPALEQMRDTLTTKAKAFSEIIKVGRTHLMDATPLTLGQEFSGYASQVEHGIEAINGALTHLYELAIGGTAVGTGINAPVQFGEKMAIELSKLTGYSFIRAKNSFEALASSDAIVEMSGALKRVATSFMKIANDIRWLASGPRCGIGEITIPANEPGSSIMPGKVNPTQSESMTMIAAQVIGNDSAISIGGASGNFELNVFRPMMIYNLLQSIRLLGDSAKSFTSRCLCGLEANEPVIADHLEKSLMNATALAPEIGYDTTAKVVKKAFSEGITLKEAALSLNVITEDRFDKLLDTKKLI